MHILGFIAIVYVIVVAGLGVIGISGVILGLLIRYDTSDDPRYGYADEELDRREQIKREGGARIMEFKR